MTSNEKHVACLAGAIRSSIAALPASRDRDIPPQPQQTRVGRGVGGSSWPQGGGEHSQRALVRIGDRLSESLREGRKPSEDKDVFPVARFISRGNPNMFYLIGLGLCDEKDITIRGLEVRTTDQIKGWSLKTFLGCQRVFPCLSRGVHQHSNDQQGKIGEPDLTFHHDRI